MLTRQQSCSVQSTPFENPHNSIIKRVNSHSIIQEDNIYEMIVTHNVIKSIQIISIKKEKDTKSLTKNHIVTYVIEIKTDYFDYQIEKRYKQFLALYDQLKSQIELPKFPEKKLFQTNKRKIIEERKEVFQSILQILIDNLLTINYSDFLQFIKIREQFLKRGCTNIRLHGVSTDQFSLNELQNNNPQKYQPQNDTERMIFHYIQKLNSEKQDSGKIFTKLQNYLFGKLTMVTYNMIQYLLIGDPDQSISGLIHRCSVDLIEQEHHIACTPGLQLLRKLLEYDYNPCAEVALKAFCDISMKQMKTMKIAIHINGEIPKKCKENALIILHKYVQGNPSLSDQFLQFMLEDEECYKIYQTYRNAQKQLIDSYKNLDSSEELSKSGDTVRKSSSKELTLDEDSSPEYLSSLIKKEFNWKIVITYKNCVLSHMYGQFVRNMYKLPNCSLERGYQLFTQEKQWKKQFNKFEILEIINDSNFIAYEQYTWSQKSTYSTFIFISQFQVTKTENKISIKVRTPKEYSKKQLDLIQKGQQLCIQHLLYLGSKVSYVEISVEDNQFCQIVTLKNLIDQEHKTHYLPQLLNEDQSFQNGIDKLYQMI